MWIYDRQDGSRQAAQYLGCLFFKMRLDNFVCRMVRDWVYANIVVKLLARHFSVKTTNLLRNIMVFWSAVDLVSYLIHRARRGWPPIFPYHLDR